MPHASPERRAVQTKSLSRVQGAAGAPNAASASMCTFGILLVLELALDDLGLGATAGALNPLDVLVILVGGQDCLQLRVCYLKESGFIWVYTSTFTLSC